MFLGDATVTANVIKCTFPYKAYIQLLVMHEDKQTLHIILLQVVSCIISSGTITM